MIRLEQMEYLTKLATFTPYVKNEVPVSMVLCAPAEHGKTEVLKKFHQNSTIKLLTNFDTMSFLDIVPDLESEKIKTIMILDFLRVVKRKYSTSTNSLTILSALTEEGWHGTLPLGRRIDKPLRANVVTAITEDEIMDKRHKWSSIGFLSRFVPVTYRYNEDTEAMVRQYIKDRKYQTDDAIILEYPKKPVDITLPSDIANELENINLKIAKANNIFGFRLQRQLQTLAMANALMSGRNLVTNSDLEIIQKLSKHINFNFNKV